MATESLSASFAIDTTDLKTGLTQANRLIRESESEFKAAAAGMDDWSSSQEGLEARINSLGNIITVQRKKVDALKNEYSRLIAEGLDPASAAAVDLQTKINNETAALNKNESVLKKNQQALDDLGNSSDDAGGGLEGLKGAAGVAAGAVAAVGAACAAAVGAFFGLAESTRESRTAMGKLETAFATAGLSAQAAEDTFTELYGVLGDEGTATEAAQQLAQYADTEAELAEQTRILTGVFATYGDSIDSASLAEGIASTIAMSEVQGTLADALEWQGVNLDDFNESLAACATEQEREALITETLNGLYGEAADKYKEVNADVIAAQEAQAGLTQAMNDLGAIAEPVMTTLKTLATDLLVAITPFVGMMGEGLQGALEGTAGASEQLAAGLSGMITSLLDTATNMLPMVIDVLVTVVPLLITALLARLPEILTALIAMSMQIISAITTVLPQILTAIMQILPLLINSLIAAIPQLLQAAIKLLLAIVEAIPTLVKSLISALPSVIKTIISTLISSIPILIGAAIDLFMAIVKAIPEILPELIAAVPEIITAITDGLAEGISSVFTIGQDIVRGLWDGIKDMGGWISEKLAGFGESVLGSIKDFFGIESPSRVMADVVGKNLALGVGTGFEDEIGSVNKKITGSVDAIVSGGNTPHINSRNSGGVIASNGGGVTVNQTNHFANAHSRYEMYQSRKQLAAAVRLAKA